MRRDQFELEPGQNIDRYQLLVPVASEDTARVWAAHVRGTFGFETLVALRALSSHGSDPRNDAHRFELEAQLASRIQHPQVAECLDLVEHNGLSCSIMEWIEGRSLGELLRKSSGEGPLPLPVALQIIVQACKGLKAVHDLRGPDGRALGWVHGEVSPHSFMVDTEGTVKLVDFGIIREAPSRTVSDAEWSMEQSFVAPELARGERVDARADVFSLGAILYLLTTSRHPRAPIVPPSGVVQGYPKALERLVMRALSHQRERRFQSVAEMLDELVAIFPGNGLGGELVELLHSLCGDDILRERRQIDEAIERYSATDSMRSPSLAMPTTRTTRHTLSPYCVTTEAVDANAARSKPGRVALAVAAIAFVTAFALTIVLSSLRPLGSVPAAQAVPAAEPLASESAHSNRPAEPRAEPAERLDAPVVPDPVKSESSPAPARSEPAVVRPRGTKSKEDASNVVLRRYGI